MHSLFSLVHNVPAHNNALGDLNTNLTLGRAVTIVQDDARVRIAARYILVYHREFFPSGVCLKAGRRMRDVFWPRPLSH
jgi:hypothetical protein